MPLIKNESGFRAAIEPLDFAAQRQLAAAFTVHVLGLSDDSRLHHAVQVAANPKATEAELGASFKAVKAASLESHTRCGAEGDWTAQAAYFVARACEAALTPEAYKKDGNALQAATSARMATTARSIDTADGGEVSEREAQYHILNEFLNKRGLT